MATYSIGDLSRREILRMSAALAIGSVASTRFAMAQTTAQRTPEQILGPFYPMKTLDQNADLTKVPGRPGRAAGLVLNVMGRVLNLKGEPVRNAKVEIWQANSHGRYISDPCLERSLFEAQRTLVGTGSVAIDQSEHRTPLRIRWFPAPSRVIA